MFPKNYFPLSVCDHKHNADMSFTEQTDTSKLLSSSLMEMWGFENNIRLGAFVNETHGDNVDLKNVRDTGLINFDIYFNTDKWKNPNTGTIELSPDFGLANWTALGASYFNVNIGDPKEIRSPEHGQEMYDLSGGAYGYDYTTSTEGASQQSELIGIIDNQKNWYLGLFGRDASSISYRVGITGGSVSQMPYFIGGRNSNCQENSLLPATINDPLNTFYGVGLGYDPYARSSVTRDSITNHNISFRFYDYYLSNGVTDANAILDREIPKAIIDKGWYRDFTHWHNADAELLTMKDYLVRCNSLLSGSDVYSCSEGEAIEYMFLREIVDRVSAQEKNNSIYVVADVIDTYKNTFTDGVPNEINLPNINQMLSVKIDITGSYLVGKNVVSNFGKIIDLGGNELIVEIPFNQKELFQGVILSEGNGGYYNTTIPTITPSLNVLDLTVVSDMGVKAVLFEVATGGNEIDYTISSRSNTINDTHYFTLEVGKDYKVGVISEFGKSNLINI